MNNSSEEKEDISDETFESEFRRRWKSEDWMLSKLEREKEVDERIHQLVKYEFDKQNYRLIIIASLLVFFIFGGGYSAFTIVIPNAARSALEEKVGRDLIGNIQKTGDKVNRIYDDSNMLLESLKANYSGIKAGIEANLKYDKGFQKVVTGPPGGKGERGLQGSPGGKGERGLQGSPGEKGERGLQGSPGEKGERGLQGSPGGKGERGLQGSPGEKGERGLQGSPGEKGERGLQGSPGGKGERGLQGSPGEKGERGLTGLKGEKGERGPTGLKGEKGERGLTGLKGEKGERGPTGLKGEKGERGLQGEEKTLSPTPSGM